RSWLYPLSLHDALPILGPILTAVFPCTLRPQQLAVFPAYFQFTHSRTTSNPFNQSKIPGAGGLDGDASRPDCERSRNQGAFGGRDRKSTRLNSSHLGIS